MTTARNASEERIPVSIITGFLGSGKTTLLNRLLQHPSMAQSLVIINEFGEIGIDHLLVSVPSENMLLLNNGCLCCVFKGDLADTFADIHAKRARGEIPAFDRVIVETTGLADPVPVIQTIVTDEEIGRHFQLGVVVTLVDGVHGAAQLERGFESTKQVAAADSLLISKADLATDAQVAGLREKLAAVNPGARVFNVSHGEFDPDVLFAGGARDAGARAADIGRWVNAQPYRERRGGAHFASPVHRPQAGGLHDAGVLTFTLYHETPVKHTALALWLNMLASLRGQDLLRAKGIVNVDGEPVVIHVVQTVVHEPQALAAWPDDDRRSRIVFITRGIAQDEIARTLDAFQLADAAIPRGNAIDPAAYANFARLARVFVR